MMGGPTGPNADIKKQATTWLIIAAVSAFFCGNCCLGVIGAIFSFMAMQAADQGNTADAEGKAKWGKILTIVGLVLTVISYVVFGIIYAAEIALMLSGNAH
jgi:hypothetical protein